MTAAISDGKVTTAPSAPAAAIAAVEFPTLLLLLGTYGGWLAITSRYGHWPTAVVVPLTVVLMALHSSLQHELVHGHPTRWYGVNRLLGIVPLSLWMPFVRYRQTHLVHHRDERLTDPRDDPESYYWTAEDLARLSPPTRLMLRIQQTLAGRIIIGSFWRIGMYLHGEVRVWLRNEQGARAIWLEHLLWCVPVLLWVTQVCGMPFWLYLVAMVFPANGIILIRSFAEHRAAPGVRARIAIVERSWILGPLFLFNNLHSLHHETPSLPWYQYNRRYRLERARLLAENGGLVYDTYFDVARRFLVRPHDALRHPMGRVPVIQAG